MIGQSTDYKSSSSFKRVKLIVLVLGPAEGRELGVLWGSALHAGKGADAPARRVRVTLMS